MPSQKRCLPLLSIAGLAVAVSGAATAAPLTLTGSTDIPGYKGDFDHFAVDRGHGRLFLAGEENHELIVMNLGTAKILARLPGYGAPHSPFLLDGGRELLVVDGEKPSPVLDPVSLKTLRSYVLPAGSDSVGYDAPNKRLWIVTGGKDVPQKDSNLIAIDPATGKTLQSVHFDADHVEAMAVEQAGPRLYINITDKNALAVVDKAAGKVTATWPVTVAKQNACIAMDEANRRLFVVTRGPGMLLVMNADTGAVIQTFKAPERTDQLTWDPKNRRLYVTGGEGYISVVEQDGADHYREAGMVPSAPGAKTAVLDSEDGKLFVAASPGDTGAMGKVLVFDVAPR